jgi:succinate-acetate transporter protein
MNEKLEHTTAERKYPFLLLPRRCPKHDSSLQIVLVDSFCDLFFLLFCNVIHKAADVLDNIAGYIGSVTATDHTYSLIESQFV